MLHSVKEIGRRYSEISSKREVGKKLFKCDDFLKYVKDNIKKYSIIENGYDYLCITSDDKQSF